MATVGFDLNTWYAKRIIGDNAANSADDALLQIGTGVTEDTWILNKTGRASDYGIKYVYDYNSANVGHEEGANDKIELYGGYQENNTDAPTAWVQLNTGDVYLAGHVGINHSPDSTIRLYVDGITYVSDYIYRTFAASNEEPMIWMHGSNYDNYLWQISSGDSTKQHYGYGLKYIGTGSGIANYLQLIADNQGGTDVIAIGIDQGGRVGIGKDASSTYRLDVSGTGQFSDTVRVKQLIITDKDAHAHLLFSRDGTSPYNYIVIPADVAGNPKTMLSIGNGASTSSGTSYFKITSETTTVMPSTATSSKTTGALVVNGGIGVAGDIYIGGKIHRGGPTSTSNWNKGRDNAIFVLSSIASTKYNPWGSIKTTNGSWDIGNYDSGTFKNKLLFTYVSDTTYNGSSATYDQQISFSNTGSIWAGKAPTVNTDSASSVEIGAQAGAGKLYLEISLSKTGTKSIILANTYGFEATAFQFNQNNEIDGITAINTDTIFRVGGERDRVSTAADIDRYIFFKDNASTTTNNQVIYTNNTVGYINSQLNTDNSNRLRLAAVNNLGVEKVLTICAPTQGDINTSEVGYITWTDGQVDNSIYPYSTGTYDLGSEELGWNHLYICGSTSNSHALTGTNPYIEFSNSDRTEYGRLIYTDSDSQGDDQSLAFIGNTGNTVTWIKAGGFVSNAANKVKKDDGVAGITIDNTGEIHLTEVNASGSERGGYIGFHYHGSTSATSYIAGYNNNVIGIYDYLGIKTNTRSQTLSGKTTTTDFTLSVNGAAWVKNAVYSNTGIYVYRNAEGDGGFRLYEGYSDAVTTYAWLYISKLGTTDTLGYTNLQLGNTVAKNTAHNARGRIYLYGENGYASIIYSDTTNFTTSRGFHLPNYDDTQYAVHAGSTAAVGGQYNPVYVAANGRVTAITAGTTAQFYRGDKTWSSTLTGVLTLYRESATTDNSPAGISFNNKDTTVNRLQNTAYIYAYNTHSDDNNGMNLVINSAGNVFIGGGESAANLYSNKYTTSTGENLFITSDGSIYLEAGAANTTAANRVGLQINSSGHILPQKEEAANSNAQNIGASNNKFANVYATTFTGALAGNADSATKLETAREIYVALGTTRDANSKVTFDGTADKAIHVSGTLPVGRGGTGKTTAVDACNAFINALSTGTSVNGGDDYLITQYVGGGTTTTTYHRRMAKYVRVGGLTTAREIYVALGSTRNADSKVTFDGTADKAIHVSGTLGTARGGTGNTSFTQWGIIYANPATKLVSTAAGTSGYLLQGNGSAAPSWIQATNSNTANTIVKRDGSGNFNAGTISATLTGSHWGSQYYRTGLTKGTNPSSTTWTSAWFNYQTGSGTAVADRVAGGIESYVDANGLSVLCLRAYQFSSGSSTQNTLEIRCAKDGTATYAVTNQANFRSAISAPSTTGSGASGSWGISVTGSSASCTGNAATATRINGNLAAITDSGGHNIWVSSGSGGDGIPKIVSGVYIAPSTKSVVAQNFFVNGGSIIFTYNGSNWTVVPNYANGNTGLNACGQGVYLGYSNSKAVYFHTIDSGSGTGTQRGYVNSQGIHGAVWNDFAEFRESNYKEPGRVVIDNGNGVLNLCNERLVSGARVISDTYGISVGYSTIQDTPIGVGGRVLVYPYQNRNNYKVGDAVCSAPNGTVDIMTREEIKEYPERIIGIVSEVPKYTTWSQKATKKDKSVSVQVRGRIWIYVR